MDRLAAVFVQLNKGTLRRAGRRLTVFLSVFVVLGVFWTLKLTGITLAGEAFCGFQEHRHDESCTQAVPVCQVSESPGHSHNESCLPQTLICTQPELAAHIHEESCLDRELVCTVPEGEGHTHSDSCRGKVLTCETEESEGHTHGDGCFAETLACAGEDPAHIHGPECYERTLTCEQAEGEGHLHGDGCFTPGEALPCGQEETAAHTHTDSCYSSLEGSFRCGQEETTGHTHGPECYQPGTEIVCGKAEAEGHVHSEECYETQSVCTLPEHIHTESCYSDITADLETREDWERSLSEVAEELTTAEKLVSVARSQLGYTESTLNFEVDLLGVRRGITRYGQWYGNPYGDWSAMFASFCVHYAGATELPANAGPESMRLEWEKEGLYASAEQGVPKIGNLIFLKAEPELRGELVKIGRTQVEPDREAVPSTSQEDAAAAVGIITNISDEGITLIQGNLADSVAERTIPMDSPIILGYGLVPERSPYAVQAVPTGELHQLAKTIRYSTNIFTSGRTFILYTERGGNYYAIDGNGNAVLVWIQDGGVYSDSASVDSLRWTFTSTGNGRYRIQNVGTGRYLHPYYNSDNDWGIIHTANWDTPVSASGTGAKFIHSASAVLNEDGTAFGITRDQNQASVFYFGAAETCTVWLDGTDGGLSSLGGSQNQNIQVAAPSRLTLPSQWLSPTKYNFRLRGWYDVTHDLYYAPGETVTIQEDTVFYADWMADTYDIGQYNAHVANTVSTNSFITTRIFDYNYLFNVLSADSTGSVSNSGHSESWAIVQGENVDYQNRETLDFIFLDYGDGGTLDYPNNRRDGVNQYPGDDIVTGGIYNDRISQALFSTDDHVPGKVYLGTADHLFQIMDDPGDPYYGYYYYDSAKNAASYNQSAGRFYVYDYLEATSAELSSSKSDFLPLNSPYANTNGQQLGTYVPDGEHAGVTNYVYDAKYDGDGSSVDRVSSNYAFGMKTEIRFYLPNRPGEGGNQDLNGNDMRFYFSGDDDLWILVDGVLALDIGGIHQAETGEINFSTGEVLIQGQRNNALSNVVANLEPGEHTLTMMYLERGASHSNCAIYFNLAPRYSLNIQKEDVLTRNVLNSAQFSLFQDLECTVPAELWTSEESYLRGDPATNVFTVEDGTAHVWGLGAGNTYYIKETRPPEDPEYGFPNGIIRMVLDKRGAATYSVMILDGGDGISGGFTVHGFRVDEETQEVDIVATNAPKWVQEVTSVQAVKLWSDSADHSAESITVYLTVHDPDGTVLRLQEAILSEETDWQHLWENLPKYYEDGTRIQYGVEEAYVPGYYSKVEQVTDYTVTTRHWTAAASLESGRTYLLRTGSGYLSTTGNAADTGYMWVDEETAKQSELAQWQVTVNGNTYRFTNLAGQIITFYYGNGNPTDFFASTAAGENNNVKQYFRTAFTNQGQFCMWYAASNRSCYLTSSMNSSGKFGYAASSSGGLLFTPMTLTEAAVTRPVEGEQAYQITNTPLQRETSVTVHKEWYNHLGDDPGLYEQARVTVRLLANGRDTGRRVTLSLKNGWTDAFRGLPYQDDNGNVIQYTIEETWYSKDWLPEYGPVITHSGSTPTYDTTVTNVYRWGHGVELPATGTNARMLYMLCGSGIMLLTLVYGTVSRRKRERRMK